MFTEEKNTHNTNKPLPAQLRLTVAGCAASGAVFPRRMEQSASSG